MPSIDCPLSPWNRGQGCIRLEGRVTHVSLGPSLCQIFFLYIIPWCLQQAWKVGIITYPHFAHGSIEARKIARLFQGHVASEGWSQSAPALHCWLDSSFTFGWTLLNSGVGNGSPLQYSYLENSVDRRACLSTVHIITKNQLRLSDWANILYIIIYYLHTFDICCCCC